MSNNKSPVPPRITAEMLLEQLKFVPDLTIEPCCENNTLEVLKTAIVNANADGRDSARVRSVSPDAERIAEIRERLAHTTPGPWECETDEQYISAERKHYLQQWIMDSDGKRLLDADSSELVLIGLDDEGTVYDINATNNLDFVAHSREDIPYLLSLVDSRIGAPDAQFQSPDENALHIAICQAVALLNRTVNDAEQRQAHEILRMALDNYGRNT